MTLFPHHQVLVTLVFTPSVWKSLQLDIAFQTGSLMVMVDISVAGKVIWNGMQVGGCVHRASLSSCVCSWA